jgi:hypothetical protein
MALYALCLALILSGCATLGSRSTAGKGTNREGLTQLLKTKSASPAATGNGLPSNAVHLEVSGRDNQTSRSLALNAGLAIFHVTYQGTGDYSFLLLDDNGDPVEDIADGHGAFAGSTAIGIDQFCDCTVDVQTSGPWTVTVDQPSALSGGAVPTTLTGSGQAASTAFQSAGGLTTFHQRVRDSGGGRVTLLNSIGEVLDVLGEGDSAFDRSRTVELDPGTYLLQVDTDGPWTVDVAAWPGSR